MNNSKTEHGARSRHQRPKVLLVSTNADNAGAPKHVEALANGLCDKVNFSILVGDTGPVFQRLKAQNFQIEKLFGLRSDLRPLKDIATLLRLIRYIVTHKPDIIHCHSSKAGLLCRLAGLFTGRRVLFTVHGWSWNSVEGQKRKIIAFLERVLARIPNIRYIYVCNYIEQTGAKLLKIPKSQSTVIHNGVDAIILEAQQRTHVTFLMAARAAYPKDYETLLRAFNLIDGPAKLMLCGAGTEQEIFKSKCKDWCPNRYSDVAFNGDQSDTCKMWSSCDVAVLSSDSEAFPLSVLEAMSASLPVIATDVGGVSEAITPERSGFLFPAKDFIALSKTMQRLMDRKLRSHIGSNARSEYLRKFTTDIMCEKTLNAYLDLLASR